MMTSRRSFLQQTLLLGSAGLAVTALPGGWTFSDETPSGPLKLGLVTYQWGQNRDLPTLIENCAKTQIYGLELRTKHKHGVEPDISAAKRQEVKKRFDESPVKLVGFGTTECFDHAEPEKLQRAIEATQAFIKLSVDCGGSGVKVRPNNFHSEIPKERTIAQVAESLNAVGKFAADYGQEIRLEVHGSMCDLSTMKAVMERVLRKNVGLCWNCNQQDLKGEGLAANFNLVKDRLGRTVHVHELASAGYPYRELFDLLVKNGYAGWLLLECSSKPGNYLAALRAQREALGKLMSAA